TDQMALNLGIHGQGLFPRTEMLPAWCNWILNGLPAWDPVACRLTEPYLPLHPIGILHLAGAKQTREAELSTTDGNTLRVPLRYSDLVQFTAACSNSKSA